MSEYPLTGLFFVALFAAGCAYFFNRQLAKSAREWEIKTHIVKTAEDFCDELTDLAIAYWSREIVDGNRAEMALLADKIAARNLLLMSYIGKNFPRLMKDSWRVVSVVVGGDFGKDSRKEDSERAAHSVSEIVQLRMAISESRDAESH